MGIQDRVNLDLAEQWEAAKRSGPEVWSWTVTTAPHALTPSTTVMRVMTTTPDVYAYITLSPGNFVIHTNHEGAAAEPFVSWSNELTPSVMPIFKAIHDWYEEQMSSGNEGT